MLSNYLKMAWRVLGRKKLFTAISLFGISFTLGLLMVMLSFFQNELGSDRPLTYKSDMVFVDNIKLSKVYYDTLVVMDTAIVDGVEVVDSTFEYKRTGSGNSSSSANHNMFLNTLSDIDVIDLFTIYSPSYDNVLYKNGSKITVDIVSADQNYWEVLDHELLYGRKFNKEDFDNEALVVVIGDEFSKLYFGSVEGAMGQTVEMEDKDYEVIGIIKQSSKIMAPVSPDIVTPYSTMPLEAQEYYFGYFNALVRKDPNVTLRVVKDRIALAAGKIELDHPDNKFDYSEASFITAGYNERFSQGIYYDDNEETSYRIVKYIILGLLLFFILLPTINLINLNVSRIMERSSEIGVRKAFGADRFNIVTQFIVENIVLTLIGGFIGFLLAVALIYLINSGGYLGDSKLMLNTKFFFYCLFVTLIFGVLSGLMPAWKMSKIQIVNALKQNKI